MSSPAFSKSLIDALGISDRAVFDYTTLVRLLKAIEARLNPLEDQSGSLDAAIEAIRKVGLDRINEVLVPAIQLILEFQSKGFLVASSSTAATLGNGNILTLIIGDEQGRAIFTPAPFVALTREATPNDYAICRTVSYVQDSGVYICEVVAFAGAAGPHSDWVIGALAGSTIAQQTMLTAAQALSAQVAADRITVGNDKTVVATDKGLAAGYRDAAAGSAAAALASKNSAAASAALAVASAGQIIDVLDRVDVLPTLNLDLADINGAPFKGNLTRATSGGYRQNSKGVLVPTAVNEPVIDYGSDGKPRGAGFFGAYTNLSPYSQEFDNASWIKAEATLTANAAVAPDGTTTMDKIVESTNNATHQIHRTIGITSGLMYNWSVYVAAAGRTKCRLDAGDGDVGAGNYVEFDLVAKTATNVGNAVGSIEEVISGLFRISATFTAIATVGAAFFILALRSDAGTGVYAGDGTSGIYIWGAQLTATASPVPYVPTTSAAVVRNADSFIITGSDFTDFFNPVEGTIYIDGDIVGEHASGVQYLFSFDSGTADNRIAIRQGAVITGADLFVNASGAVVCDTASANIRSRNAFRLGASFGSNLFRFASAGAIVDTDTSGAIPVITRLQVNPAIGAYIRRLIYWPKAFDAATLQRITA